MRVSVKKSSKSRRVGIPTRIMQAVGLKLNDAVEVREEKGRIIIKPIRNAEYELTKLLAGINKKNLHGEADFGALVGREYAQR